MELPLSRTRPTAAQHDPCVHCPHQVLRVRPGQGQKTQRLRPHPVIATNGKDSAHYKVNDCTKAEVLFGAQGRLPRLNQKHLQQQASRAHPL